VERSLSGMPQHHDFTDDTVDAAIDFIIENGAQDRGQTISYSRVFDAAGLPPPQDLHFGGESQLVTLFMARLHFRCRERTLPPLDALVVHVAGERIEFPGAGYFRVNGQADPLNQRTSATGQTQATVFWDAQKTECKDWGDRSRRGQVLPGPDEGVPYSGRPMSLLISKPD
jgi:hypothetical protein